MNESEHSVYETDRTGGDGKGSGHVKSQDMALMQERLLETVSYFHDFCDQYGIRYILVGGTCIGAVREHGFVPWDGDVDVAVLREDYDKLYQLWEEHGDKQNFSLYRTTDDFCPYVAIGLMRNNNTTFIRVFEDGLTDRNLGVKIDIEPFDEIPTNPLKRRLQRFYAYIYIALSTQRKPRRKSKLMTVGVIAVNWLFRNKALRNRLIHFTGRQVKKYNGTGCEQVALNGLNGAITKNIFLDRIKVPFEDKEFYIPVQYDVYLTDEYGDYMQRPPVEKRIFRDNPVYYDLNLPYRDYLAQRS